jgi:hypothetical protein
VEGFYWPVTSSYDGGGIVGCFVISISEKIRLIIRIAYLVF